MKKRILALTCALAMTLGMSMTALAANSPATNIVAQSVSGQVITTETLAAYAAGTSMTTEVAGATVTEVAKDQAAVLVAAADAQVGENATIATMVDIQVPEGTGEANFTLGVPSLVAGQSVTVLHLKSDGTIESLPIVEVATGSVTFTMSSYSPVAVVVNATAPKTGEGSMMVVLLIAAAGLAGAAFFGRKAAN